MDQEKQTPSVFHDMTKTVSGVLPMNAVIMIFVVVILLGIGVGYGLARSKNGLSSSQVMQTTTAGNISKGAVFGTNDTSVFKDTAEGIMQAGGIDGEGQFHLVRPGGDSQNVYLTSAVVDLSKFIGHKVKVWGQTQAAKKAGWLMDVGRVEVEQ